MSVSGSMIVLITVSRFIRFKVGDMAGAVARSSQAAGGETAQG